MRASPRSDSLIKATARVSTLVVVGFRGVNTCSELANVERLALEPAGPRFELRCGPNAIFAATRSWLHELVEVRVQKEFRPTGRLEDKSMVFGYDCCEKECGYECGYECGDRDKKLTAR